MPGAARLDYDGCAADTTKVDALVVTNAHGTVVGQLLGDGVGIEATKGSFQDAYLCLDLRTDVNVHSDLFSTKAVARYAEGAFDILDAALASDSTNAKYCVTVYETGTFFPVLVASDVDAACSADCAGDGGVCLGDSCACFCGFSGSTCAAGCKNDCSGAGACDEDTNACACDGTSCPPAPFVGHSVGAAPAVTTPAPPMGGLWWSSSPSGSASSSEEDEL